MSTLVTIDNCPDCNVEVLQNHSESCKVETCKTCGLSRKRGNGCKCESYVPMSPVWNGQIMSRAESLMPLVSWNLLFKIRDAVNAELEVLRQAKVIGKGIEAAAIVDISPDVRRMIELFPSELSEFFGVSEFTFGSHHKNTEVNVSVLSLKGYYEKCDRCFRHNKSVAIHEYWPTYKLCVRCVDVLLELRWPPYIVLNPETMDCHVCSGEIEWHELKMKENQAR